MDVEGEELVVRPTDVPLGETKALPITGFLCGHELLAAAEGRSARSFFPTLCDVNDDMRTIAPVVHRL